MRFEKSGRGEEVQRFRAGKKKRLHIDMNLLRTEITNHDVRTVNESLRRRAEILDTWLSTIVKESRSVIKEKDEDNWKLRTLK